MQVIYTKKFYQLKEQNNTLKRKKSSQALETVLRKVLIHLIHRNHDIFASLSYNILYNIYIYKIYILYIYKIIFIGNVESSSQKVRYICSCPVGQSSLSSIIER